MQDISSRIKQKFLCSSTNMHQYSKEKRIKEKKMKGLAVILLVHCTVKTTLTHHSNLQFYFIFNMHSG